MGTGRVLACLRWLPAAKEEEEGPGFSGAQKAEDGDCSLCKGNLLLGQVLTPSHRDAFGLDQRGWWTGLRKEESPAHSGQTFWLSAWCHSVQALLVWRNREAPLSTAGLGLEEPAESCFKGFCLTPSGSGFAEDFSGCSFKGCREAVGSLCEELSLTLGVGFTSPQVHCFWLPQNAWELPSSFFPPSSPLLISL